MRLIGVMVLLLVVWCMPVEATDWFICDCRSGADPDCIAGSDAGAGTLGDPWQSYEKARTAFGLPMRRAISP